MSPRPALKERTLYAYSRTVRGKRTTGRIEVHQVYDQGGRWWIVGHDYKLGRTITLQPGQIGAQVRPRKS